MQRSIVEAYLRGDASSFFESHPAAENDRRRLVDTVSRPLRAPIADELEAQNARYEPSEARNRNLALLRSGAAAVVTGQQVGLFLGPLYTLYKAAAAIRNARYLSEQLGRPVVPVFWLQTEDHDLVEIASCHTPARAYELAVDPHNRLAVEHVTLSSDVEALVAQLSAELSELPHGEVHAAHIARHYRPGTTWSDAFAPILASLFSREGLVLVDPRRPAIAAEARAVHRVALERAAEISKQLQARCDALSAEGFVPSVHIRPNAPLSFFHPHRAEGPRYRLEPSAGGFTEVGGNGTHSLTQLLKALDEAPLSFSTSALLRPILQDTILPTAAYVGGPGEITYFAQLAPLYRLFERQMPLIVPRARFRLIEPEVATRLTKLGLTPKTLEHADASRQAHVEAPDTQLEVLKAAVTTALDALTRHVGTAGGAPLETPIRKTKSTVNRALGKLSQKYEARRSSPRTAQLEQLRNLLSPNGAPQERVHGLSHYAGLIGEQALIERIMAAITPFDGTLKDITL